MTGEAVARGPGTSVAEVNEDGVQPAAPTAAAHDDDAGHLETHATNGNLDVGVQLREARLRKDMSLAQVATRAGLSRSFLSKVERGLVSASLSSLVQLTGALEISVGSLFRARPASDSGRSGGLSYRGGGVIEYLLTGSDERRFEVFEQHLDPGQGPDMNAWSIDADFAFIYVISGSVEFVQCQNVQHLRQGDLHVYAPRTPHRWINASLERAVVLVCDSPAGF